MSIDYKEALNKLSKAGAGKSRLSLRNEARQNRASSGRLPKVKKEKNKQSRLIFLKELAIPFNPYTMDTEEYNSLDKYRPEISVSSLIGVLKTYYNENSEAKEKFLKEAGVDSWDTSKPEEVTKEDRDVFKKYTVTKIISNDMMNITSPIMNKVKFPCPYRVTYKRDEFGEVVIEPGKEYPKELAIANFYKSVYIEAYNEWEANNKNKSDADKKEEFKKFIKKVPVSNDYVQNTLAVFELPLDSNLQVANLGDMTKEDIKKHLFNINLSSSLKTQLEDLTGRYAERRDIYTDILECDMIVGNEDDDMLRGKNTKFPNAEVPLKDMPGFDKFYANLVEVIDELDNLESLLYRSVARNKIDDNTLEVLAEAMAKEQPIEVIEKWISQDSIKRNSGIISFIYGDDANDLFISPEEQLEGTVTKEQEKLADINLKEELSEEAFSDVTLTDDADDDGDE